MADETLEQRVDNAAQPEKKEEPKISGLQNMFNETSDALRFIGNTALAVGMPLTLTHVVQSPGLNIDTYSFTAANVAADATTNFRRGKTHTIGEIAKSSAVASILALPIHYLYKVINSIPLDTIGGYFGRAAAFGGLAYPFFTGLYQSVDYTIRNGFKGLGKYLKENYWPTLKKAWKYILPISLLNIFFVPAYWQVAVGSALSYFYALFGAPKGELKESDKRGNAYLLNYINPFYYFGGAGGIYNKLASRASDLGTWVRDRFEQLTPKPQPSPQTATATT